MKYLITIVCAAFGFIIINPVLANSCSSSSAYCMYFVGLQTGEKRLLKISGSKNGTASGSRLLCVSNDDTLELTQQDAVGIKKGTMSVDICKSKTNCGKHVATNNFTITKNAQGKYTGNPKQFPVNLGAFGQYPSCNPSINPTDYHKI